MNIYARKYAGFSLQIIKMCVCANDKSAVKRARKFISKVFLPQIH